jgi:hypothetical protein
MPPTNSRSLHRGKTMERRTFVTAAVVLSAVLAFGSAALGGRVLAQLLEPRPDELVDPEDWISDVHTDGVSAVWLEQRDTPRGPTARLAVHTVADGETRYHDLDEPGVRRGAPLDWLVDGPKVGGDTVVWRVLAADGALHLRALQLPGGTSWTVTESAGDPAPMLDGLAIDGRRVVFTRHAAVPFDDLDLWLYDLENDTAAPAVTLRGDQVAPQLSDSWIVWVDVDDDAPGSRLALRARPVGGSAERWLDDSPHLDPRFALHGRRVLWRSEHPETRGTALWLADLASGGKGVVQVLPPQEPGGVGLSGDLIVASHGRTGGTRRPSQLPLVRGHLTAYDARAVTSFDNLASYLTAFTVADTTTASVRPAVVGSTVLWAEPDPEEPAHADDRHVMRVFLARARIYLPWVGDSASP